MFSVKATPLGHWTGVTHSGLDSATPTNFNLQVKIGEHGDIMVHYKGVVCQAGRGIPVGTLEEGKRRTHRHWGNRQGSEEKVEALWFLSLWSLALH